MKTITLFLLLSMVTFFSAEAHKYKSGHNRAHVTITIQTFYDELSPYGDWVYTPDYGYVWRPYFDYPDAFRPYSSNGHWVNTDFGWTWVSDYRWGWATFHYGRWAFDDYLGWMWVPGYEWAPAWVSWGYYGDYYGWAPLGPNVYAYTTSNWYAPDPWWTFVPRRHFCSGNWNTYIYDRPVHVTNITHITNVYVNNNNYNTNNSWYYGPRVSEVERYTKTRVRRMEVIDSERPDNTGIRNDRLNVYRPQVDGKRNDYRPADYRSVEQARTRERIQQTNARTNNPGINRTRNSSQLADSRNTGIKGETRTEPRTSVQNSTSRTSDVKRDVKSATRDASKTVKRESPAKRQTSTEPRTSQRDVKTGNVTRPTERNRTEMTEKEKKSRVTENRNSGPTTRRESNSENQKSSTVTREQKMQKANTEVRKTSSSADRKQAPKEEIRKAEPRKTDRDPKKTSSAKPTRK
jgi:hypothetical protein